LLEVVFKYILINLSYQAAADNKLGLLTELVELCVDALHWKLEHRIHRMLPEMNFVMKMREQRVNMAAC
jgi:hypothetical protein